MSPVEFCDWLDLYIEPYEEKEEFQKIISNLNKVYDYLKNTEQINVNLKLNEEQRKDLTTIVTQTTDYPFIYCYTDNFQSNEEIY